MNRSRRPLIAGNWKMHHGGQSGFVLAAECVKIARAVPHVDVVIAPPYTVLAAVAQDCREAGLGLSAQNVHARDHGAFTGEISASMLVEAGCGWVIVGHSERRQLFGDTDETVAEKTAASFAAGLRPIVCVGETLAQRELGDTLRVVKLQVSAVLDLLAAHDVATAIAYEPVWAIGTGRNASPGDAEEVHAMIRVLLAERNPKLAERVRILYGGSVKPDNAKALLGCPNVDGALIGGASLDADSFGAIARAAESLATAS